MGINAKNVRVEINTNPKKREKDVIYFENFEEMIKVLTPSRVELIEAIKKHHPKSIYQLAIILKRDQGNVTKDVNILKKYRFIEVNESKEGDRKKFEPKVESEAIEMIVKLGAGTFGIAKDIVEDISGEFKDQKLEENKKYAKQEYKKMVKPIKETVKKVAREFDIETKEE